MIAMSMLSTYDEYRRDLVATVHSSPTHSVRHAMMHALSMIGLGLGGVAAMGDDATLGAG